MFHGSSWNNSRKNAPQRPPANIFDKIGMPTHVHHTHDHYHNQGERPSSWPQKSPPPKPAVSSIEKKPKENKKKSYDDPEDPAPTRTVKSGRKIRPPIDPSHTVERKPGKINLLLGITGSLSADRMPSIIKSLQEGYEDILDIKAVATKASLEFFDPNDLQEYGVMVYEDKDMHEGGRFMKRGDPVLLIELGNWADIMLIAPVTGNTIGSIGNNLGYNLLTVIVLNWSPDKKLFWAPSVPKNMWTNSLDTRQNIYKRQNFVEICPAKNGSFAEVSDIAKFVHETIDDELKKKKSNPAPETSNAPVHARR
ncbi:flavoprotein [Ditylenchus destructor]|nr:flavoprotein [Ditylenchus destructor]